MNRHAYKQTSGTRRGIHDAILEKRLSLFSRIRYQDSFKRGPAGVFSRRFRKKKPLRKGGAFITPTWIK